MAPTYIEFLIAIFRKATRKKSKKNRDTQEDSSNASRSSSGTSRSNTDQEEDIRTSDCEFCFRTGRFHLIYLVLLRIVVSDV